MRRGLLLVLVSVTLWSSGILGAVPTRAAQDVQDERILDFSSDITIHADSSLTVKETITVRALGQSIKRGIIRDFPTVYKDRQGHRVRVSFDIVEVRRDGRLEPYHTERVGNGVRISTGHKDVFIDPGIHTYAITYRTSRQLGFFKDYDELYWNVTGTGWTFPIDHAAARIVLPQGARLLQVAAYTGPQGDRGQDYRFVDEGGGTLFFETTRKLGVGEGLTVAAAWPKGFVHEPDRVERALALLGDNRGSTLGIVGLIAVLVYYLVVWFRVGRDPEPGTIIPLFEPPYGFSPAAVRFVRNMDFDQKTFAAAVVNMAVKGHLLIRETDDTYVLVKKSSKKENLTPGEKKIADALFDSGLKEIALDNKNAAKFRKALDDLHKTLSQEYEKTYFFTNTRYMIPALGLSLAILAGLILYGTQPVMAAFLALWLSIWSLGCTALAIQVIQAWRGSRRGRLPRRLLGKFSAVGITLLALPFWAGEIGGFAFFAYSVSLLGAVILAALGGLHALFYHLLKAPTRLGRKILDHIEGFRMYLSIAEKDRLGILHPPEKTPEHFEKYLPYALALDVEQEWCEQFARVLDAADDAQKPYRPTWYSGSRWSTVGASSLTTFSDSLSGSLTSAIASASTPPGSSSGSGGGGSSGGGGGGGGGSGW
ncbi:MAG: DUF2207 domain-containing protein [Desulfosoma sp.]